jgi:hypothetical protein
MKSRKKILYKITVSDSVCFSADESTGRAGYVGVSMNVRQWSRCTLCTQHAAVYSVFKINQPTLKIGDTIQGRPTEERSVIVFSKRKW